METLKLVVFANSEDPDEMPQNVAFHPGLHYLLRRIHSKEKFANSEEPDEMLQDVTFHQGLYYLLFIDNSNLKRMIYINVTCILKLCLVTLL